MPPITWRNVDAPTALGAAAIMKQAGASANKGMGQLTSLANQVTGMRTANQKNDNRINTESALAGVAGLNSMDALNAARESGQFDPSNLAPGTDLNAVRKAMQNQNVVIDDQLSKADAFTKRQTGRDEFSTRQEVNNLLSIGDYEGARELAGSLSDQSSANNQIATKQRENVLMKRADQQYQQQQDNIANKPKREAAAATLLYDREKANIKLQHELANAPTVTPKTPEAESAAVSSVYDDLLNIAPNETYLGDTGNDAGGKDAIRMVRTGVEQLEKTLGRKVTSSEMAQARDYIKSTVSGTDNSILNLDASYSPDKIISFLTDLTGKDVEGTNRIKALASKNTKAETELQARLKAIGGSR